MREELEKFFIATDELEDKQLKILGWKGPKPTSRRSNKERKLSGTATSDVADYRNQPFAWGLICPTKSASRG
jgi:hypothetical protein